MFFKCRKNGLNSSSQSKAQLIHKKIISVKNLLNPNVTTFNNNVEQTIKKNEN